MEHLSGSETGTTTAVVGLPHVTCRSTTRIRRRMHAAQGMQAVARSRLDRARVCTRVRAYEVVRYARSRDELVADYTIIVDD